MMLWALYGAFVLSFDVLVWSFANIVVVIPSL